MRIRIVIRGAVQGVGFRPFLYRLAMAMKLTGWVSNCRQGVVIEAEGPKADLDGFLIRIQREHPERASIQGLEFSFLDPLGFSGFEIRKSDDSGAKTAFVLPDIATCPECLGEIFDPANRRYLYPFANCTNCGPRFSIVESLPYDRANTTMRRFDMCNSCRREYDDPLDRRFHAQPNACADCGPQLELWNAAGEGLTRCHEALLGAVEHLKAGLIVAVKGLGGFHMMVDALNEDAVSRLRRRKRREEKPFALMAPSLERVRDLCTVNALEARLLASPESPIVILSRLKDTVAQSVSSSVAPRNPYLGIMLPYTPLHHLLMRQLEAPVVATSGNLTDEPICIDEREAIRRLGDIADVFLIHNRPIRRHADDSIARVILGREQILRRARGYAPMPIVVKGSLPVTLAVGAHLKNTVALTTPGAHDESHVFLSQHIGDLETAEAFKAFRRVIDDFETLFEARPAATVCDLHPDYLSTQYADRRGPTVRIQHHCAHIAACMAENEMGPRALGVAFDGSGYGPDGTIWGGEFLMADMASKDAFRRVAHLRTFPLPGGDAAARRPRHTALGLLYEMAGEEAFDGSDAPMVRQMLARTFRTPRTSSAGRLFDAVASIVGLCEQVAFEGQAAMELEFCVDRRVTDSYPYAIHRRDPMVLDWEPMIRRVLADVKASVPAAAIAAMFHNTLVEMIVDVAHRIGETRVAITGGCFQNRYLTERTVERLSACGFQPYWHQRVPPNDGGIALGQAVAARSRIGGSEEQACVSQFQVR